MYQTRNDLVIPTHETSSEKNTFIMKMWCCAKLPTFLVLHRWCPSSQIDGINEDSTTIGYQIPAFECIVRSNISDKKVTEIWNAITLAFWLESCWALLTKQELMVNLQSEHISKWEIEVMVQRTTEKPIIENHALQSGFMFMFWHAAAAAAAVKIWCVVFLLVPTLSWKTCICGCGLAAQDTDHSSEQVNSSGVPILLNGVMVDSRTIHHSTSRICCLSFSLLLDG